MNNRGQTLAIFVIFIPIILILLTLIIDLGLLYIEKRSINNNTKDAVEYYLNNIESSNVLDNTKKLLNKNLDDVNITINDTDTYVEITVSKRWNSLSIKSDEDISITYKGIKDSNKIIKG